MAGLIFQGVAQKGGLLFEGVMFRDIPFIVQLISNSVGVFLFFRV